MSAFPKVAFSNQSTVWGAVLFGLARVRHKHDARPASVGDTGSALQRTSHLHVLVPEGLWSEEGQLVVLPPPEDVEVEANLHRLLRQLQADFALLEQMWPEEELEKLGAEGAQHRLPWDGLKI